MSHLVYPNGRPVDPGAQTYDDSLLAQRVPLIRAALEEMLYRGKKLKADYERGFGVWVDEMEPLTPTERTLVLREWKRITGAHEPDRRK
jgi:hypothetical protein